MAINYKKQIIGGLKTYVVHGDEKAPAVVLLHGFGSTADDLIPLANVYKENPQINWFFPEGPLEIPITPEYTGRGWFPIDIDRLKQGLQKNDEEAIRNAFPDSLLAIRQKIFTFLAELSIPLSRIFIGGFSQGAILATEMALHHFENMGGLLIFSGALFQPDEWEKLAHIHSGMPFFQSHGKDDPILPFKGALSLEKLLLKGGLKGSLESFPGGHDIPPAILIKLNHFLSKHVR